MSSGLKKLCIDQVDFVGKRVLIRVDFNVPIDKSSGQVTSTGRIEASLPTIEYVLDHGAKNVILMSHLGRPDGQKNDKYSLKPVASCLTALLAKRGRNNVVHFVSDCIGPEVEKECSQAEHGQILLLENLRFYGEEEGFIKTEAGEKIKVDDAKVQNFRDDLSKLGDIFVNDAFGTCHRAHSSMVGVSLPVKVSGFLVKKELQYFSKALIEPKRPFVAILGGAKVSDKIHLIENLLSKVNVLLLGGAMAYTFKKCISDVPIGNSLFDEEGSKIVASLVQKATMLGVKMILPCDHVCGDSFSADAKRVTVTDFDGIPEGYMGLDIGARSIEMFCKEIEKARTIIWNGPMGVFEWPSFQQGTRSLMEAVVKATKCNDAISIIGGGDTAAAVDQWNMTDGISHVSTGGGASLELLEGKQLPGITALSDA